MRLVDLVRDAYRRKIPLLGICYGLQIIARALGGRVTENPQGSELSVTEVKLRGPGRDLVGLDSLVSGLPHSFIQLLIFDRVKWLHQMHLDVVAELPHGTEVIGSSSRSEVQLLYQPDRLLGMQGHPELDGNLAKHMLDTRLREGLISKDTYADTVSRVNDSHDGDKLTVAIHKFIYATSRKSN